MNNHEGTPNKKLSYCPPRLVSHESYGRKTLYHQVNIHHTDAYDTSNYLSCYDMKMLFHLTGSIWNYNRLNQLYELISGQLIVL